jgi:hypothetical protein
MAIIINDFEVVVEPPKQAGGAPTQQAQPNKQSPRPSTRDLQALLAWQKQRQQRVQAH